MMKCLTNFYLKVFIVSCFVFSNFFEIYSQTSAKYWIAFKDKKENGYSINRPEAFLSKKAIERRKKGIAIITNEDMPVSRKYLDSVSSLGLKLVNFSRWFNGALYEVPDETILSQVKKLDFIASVEKRADAINMLAKTRILKTLPDQYYNTEFSDPIQHYGYGYNPIKMLNGIALNERGFRGKGITVAVIDAGFTNYTNLQVFDSLIYQGRILGFRDFVSPSNENPDKSTHGSIVLGCMAANAPGEYMGIAPDASYWLLRSEDDGSEYPAEEDNWLAAIEFADSAGVDLVNTSLGYSDFDNPIYNHPIDSLNGKTYRISKAAQIAAERGILVTISAGNSGRTAVPYIGVPADAYKVLTVGAVDENGNLASFSSRGIPGSLKPDVVAQGIKIASFSGNNWIPNAANGTSFSSPIMGAMSACLLQAFPNVQISVVIDAILRSSSQYNNPDFGYGYGIPDFEKAYHYLENDNKKQQPIIAFPTLVNDYLIINFLSGTEGPIRIECYNISGVKEFDIVKKEAPITITSEIQSLHNGVHIIRCTSGSQTVKIKIVKSL